jgi:ubiquitin-activating enzyme E1
VNGNPTLKEFLDWFQNEHQLEVQMLSQGVSMLWSAFVPPKKVGRGVFALIQAAERMNMRMSELVEHVSKKPLPPWSRNLLVEVMVNDAEGEDVEVGQEGGVLMTGSVCDCQGIELVRCMCLLMVR